MKLDYESILEYVTKKNRITRILLMIIGASIAALIYNCFIAPNNLVYGGLSGFAILINSVFGIDTILFINVVSIALILISIILIGIKKTSYTIVGFGAYTIMINLTAPLVQNFHLEFDSFLLAVVTHAVISGFGFGLVYKTGFNTGGSDTVVSILQHYFKMPTAYISNIINGIIVVLGAANFGITKSIYALLFLKVMNFISDYVILGVSTSKLCFIKTKKTKELDEYLTNELSIGYTIVESTNGIGFLKKDVIIVVVPSDRFYVLKQKVISMDKKAKFISNDCYTVENGKTNHLIKV